MTFKEFVASAQTSLGLVLGPTLPYKEIMYEYWPANQAETWLITDSVPAGEVWEINVIYARTVGATTCFVCILDKDNNYLGIIRYIQSGEFGDTWTGCFYISEGMKIGLQSGNVDSMNSGSIWGVMRYAPEALADLLHKVRPIPLKEDVQRARVRPDPVM